MKNKYTSASMEQAGAIAQKGTHCGMCRIDFLGTGLCPSGKKHGYLAYWPQGRMELVFHLSKGGIRPTRKLLEIANSCPLCGICDKQCNFATQLRPEIVARALKEYVQILPENEFQDVPEDEIVKGLQRIVGEKWATNDPMIILSYSRSIIPADSSQNFYVVLPENEKELSEVIKFANTNNLPFLPRSGGTLLSITSPTVLSKAFGLEQGIIIDLLRMKKLEIHPESSTATVGAGVTAFELQKAAHSHDLRANVAEAGAHVCSNIASTGISTTWQNRYGWAADNFVDVIAVDGEGNILRHSDIDRINPYATEQGFTNISLSPPVIVTEVLIKLHPVYDDEEAVFIPFYELKDALGLVLKLARRNIGLSLAVLSRKYLAEFISPTLQVARDCEEIFRENLRLNYVVDVICTKTEKKMIDQMVDYTIDSSLLRTLLFGSPKLASLKGSEFLKVLSGEDDPLKAIFAGPMRRHLEKGLVASPEQIAGIYDPDLREFFKKVYARPEMTDIIWLHEFRIFPSRLMRQRMFLPMGGVIVTSDEKNVLRWFDMFSNVGKKYNLEHALGYISPIDEGKFAMLEYDYYYDHNDADASKRVDKAIIESTEKTLAMDGILSALNFYFKGLFRKEHILFPLAKAISKDDQMLFRELLQNIIGEV